MIPTSLKGVALELYYSLLAHSIDSFDTFCTRFTTQFADCKPIVTNLASLEHVVKRENESLRQYMTCFAKAYLNIFGLHTTMAVHSIKVGLLSDPFSITLYVDPPLNMDDLRARATRYISIEEKAEVMKQAYKALPPNPQNLKKKHVGRFETYTPQNVSGVLFSVRPLH